MSTHRIKFAKRGSLIFISHLDFAHSFTRALKRAELPIKYSEGFSPHPKQVFALPLSVGMVGENELCDITLTEDFSHEEVKVYLPEETISLPRSGNRFPFYKVADKAVRKEALPPTEYTLPQKVPYPQVPKKTPGHSIMSLPHKAVRYPPWHAR